MPTFVKSLKPVGDRLRELRLEKRLTVQELSALSGVSVSGLYKLEGNFHRAGLKSLKALDQVFGPGWEKDPAA